METCTTCGQDINEVVIIGGKPYGTTCALKQLGISRFPHGFTTGDWDKVKAEIDTVVQNNKNIHITSRKITSEYWKEWTILSKAYSHARIQQNDWAVDFLSGIIDRLGYYTILAQTNFDTMEDAERGWNASSGTFPYLYSEPKRIENLSQKQRTIIYKFI